jgi:hypothetical protein
MATAANTPDTSCDYAGARVHSRLISRPRTPDARPNP